MCMRMYVFAAAASAYCTLHSMHTHTSKQNERVPVCRVGVPVCTMPVLENGAVNGNIYSKINQHTHTHTHTSLNAA